jgi:transcriptional regulator with XRE-family HTH domain
MTLRELAAALGYASYSYLGLLEIGKRKPTADVTMKVAAFFNVTTDQLLWDYLELEEDASR